MINGMFNALSGLRTSAKTSEQREQSGKHSDFRIQKSTANVSEIKSGGSQVTSTTRMNVQGGILPTGNLTDLAMTVADFFRRHFLMGV